MEVPWYVNVMRLYHTHLKVLSDEYVKFVELDEKLVVHTI